MGLAIYTDYQRGLAYRGAVDFDDLIRLALEALQLDRRLPEAPAARWPYILEDEAQDSSRLQEKILRLLTSRRRLGARGRPQPGDLRDLHHCQPQYLREFLDEPGVPHATCPTRAARPQTIMDLANTWSIGAVTQHPVPALQRCPARRHRSCRHPPATRSPTRPTTRPPSG